jgi:hypothetical protein
MRDVIFEIINQFTKGMDTYHNDGSMWFIFTDEKKWVIELTKEGTLWYNFYFFHNCFKYLSLDVVENQHYIKEWVEDTIQNGVRSTEVAYWIENTTVEDAIQNGVRSTLYTKARIVADVEDTIQNGVRSTKKGKVLSHSQVEDTIQNGVRYTPRCGVGPSADVEDIIQNGIKEINHCSVTNDENAKNAIEFGIKETHEDVYHNKGRVEGVIRNGIKETKLRKYYSNFFAKQTIKNGIKETKGIGSSEVTTKEIEKVIKETIELPDKSGELNGYGEYYARQKNMSYPHTDIVNDVITDGIKETNWRKVDNHPTYLDHILIDKD